MTKPPAVIHVDLDGAQEIYRGFKADWTSPEDPVFESGMRCMLELFAEKRVTATLFVITETLVEPRKRQWLDRAVAAGHEIASHTITHGNLLTLDRAAKRQEIFESRASLEAAFGLPVEGFRAPGYQIDRETLELLVEAGYRYDSSAFPAAVHAARLGTDRKRLVRPGRPFDGLPLVELPMVDHRPLPVPANPSYALLLGVPYFRWATSRMARRGLPATILFHLIDLADPLPRELRRGPESVLRTLSHLSSGTKRRRCAAMIDHLHRQFELVSTSRLLELEGVG